MEKFIETARVVVTNLTENPRGINAVGGLVTIGSGAVSNEITMTFPEIASTRSSGLIVDVVGESDPIFRGSPKVRRTKLGEEVMELRATVADLQRKLAGANSEGGSSSVTPSSPVAPVTPPPVSGDAVSKTAIEVLAMAEDKGVPYADFKAEAQKLLGDDTPNKKVDIIAALEDLVNKS